MFNVINPCEHHLYKSSIYSFLQDLHTAMSLEQIQDLTNAVYVLIGGEVKEFQGGMLLLKQPLETVPPEIGTYLRALCPQYKSCTEIWTGRVAFQVSQDISGGDYERLSKLLYRALYQDLVAFSIKENTPFLCLTLPLVEHLSIDMLGLWPYLLKVSPHESSDGLFHGILSLTRTTPSAPRGEIEERNSPFNPQNCDNIITS